jgi:quinol monooxygenase YgiN
LDDLSIAVVVGTFDARPGQAAEVGGLLARYAVMSRREPGCRNIDLVASLTTPGRFLVYEKWESLPAQAEHLSSPAFRELAETVAPLLASPADFGLYETISAHDLH